MEDYAEDVRAYYCIAKALKEEEKTKAGMEKRSACFGS